MSLWTWPSLSLPFLPHCEHRLMLLPHRFAIYPHSLPYLIQIRPTFLPEVTLHMWKVLTGLNPDSTWIWPTFPFPCERGFWDCTAESARLQRVVRMELLHLSGEVLCWMWLSICSLLCSLSSISSKVSPFSPTGIAVMTGELRDNQLCLAVCTFCEVSHMY